VNAVLKQIAVVGLKNVRTWTRRVGFKNAKGVPTYIWVAEESNEEAVAREIPDCPNWVRPVSFRPPCQRNDHERQWDDNHMQKPLVMERVNAEAFRVQREYVIKDGRYRLHGVRDSLHKRNFIAQVHGRQ
jgi:hypothetical protein